MRFLRNRRTFVVLAVGCAISAAGGFLLGSLESPAAGYYALGLLTTAIAVLQIVAPEALRRAPGSRSAERETRR
ncbi:MAG: hypothetical protein M3320_02345 [Actinomycetota bacterium]|nr:hypothetical protein [Actinomycetota bacterium]MDQ5807492.1 hypothetical protein [Actinomycetota bacterium]